MNLRQSVLARSAAPTCLDGDAGSALLDPLGDVSQQRALLLGRDIGVLCGLIQRGCRSVVELEQNGRPDARAADLAIVPSVATPEAAAAAIAQARRGLSPNGRIVVHATISGLGQIIQRLLTAHGFSEVSARPHRDGTVLSAAVPPKQAIAA